MQSSPIQHGEEEKRISLEYFEPADACKTSFTVKQTAWSPLMHH